MAINSFFCVKKEKFWDLLSKKNSFWVRSQSSAFGLTPPLPLCAYVLCGWPRRTNFKGRSHSDTQSKPSLSYSNCESTHTAVAFIISPNIGTSPKKSKQYQSLDLKWLEMTIHKKNLFEIYWKTTGAKKCKGSIKFRNYFCFVLFCFFFH